MCYVLLMLQVKCGNRFENATVKTFNSCAITDNDCVPQEVSSEKDWPVCSH